MVEQRLFEYEPNKPIGFFLHSSIKSKFRQQNLKSKIIAHGGKVLDSPSGADTVLVDETRIKSLQTEQLRYSLSRDEKILSIVVEPMNFIHKCINTGRFGHVFPERFPMGGRAAGYRRRVEYTVDDEMMLCWYISRRIPDPSEGGRLSLGIYNDLPELAETDPEYEWAKRHPPSSWHEHYRKNRARLDPIIQEYVDEYPPPRYARYPLSRLANKKSKLYIKSEVIEITDGSEDDSSPEELSRPTLVKPSKRPRIDTSSPFPAGERVSVEAERHPSHSMGSPGLDLHAFELEVPAPSPTLVNKASQPFEEPASNRAVRSSIVPRPSTSFRDVVHSSPALRSSLPGGDSRSNNTSRTEPSSRSLAVLSGLSHPPQTTSKYPAESSILRESAHKQSSPIPAPVRKAARRPKVPIQPPSSPSSDEEHESMWAPYKNTRSRSRSVEPASLQTTRKKSARKDRVQRTDVPLAPVLEGEIEYEHHAGGEEEDGAVEVAEEWQGKNQTGRTTMLTETMQEEYDVADHLINPSGAVSETWNPEGFGEEQDEATLRSEHRSKRGHQPLFAPDSDGDASFTTGGKGKGKGRASVKEESDEEDILQLESHQQHQVWHRASFDEDDEETNRMFSVGRERAPYPSKELMASSPEQILFNYHSSSSPLQARDQNRHTTIPVSTPAYTAKLMHSRQLAGWGSTSITPSSIGTLPEVTYLSTTPVSRPPPARVFSSSKQSQIPSTSRTHQKRRSSLESATSEVPFPLTGTKASSVKATLEQHLKESPYAPPSGTKAAAIMASQRQLRLRKQRG